jgi:hypothetical protein
VRGDRARDRVDRGRARVGFLQVHPRRAPGPLHEGDRAAQGNGIQQPPAGRQRSTRGRGAGGRVGGRRGRAPPRRVRQDERRAVEEDGVARRHGPAVDRQLQGVEAVEQANAGRAQCRGGGAWGQLAPGERRDGGDMHAQPTQRAGEKLNVRGLGVAGLDVEDEAARCGQQGQRGLGGGPVHARRFGGGQVADFLQAQPEAELAVGWGGGGGCWGGGGGGWWAAAAASTATRAERGRRHGGAGPPPAQAAATSSCRGRGRSRR